MQRHKILLVGNADLDPAQLREVYLSFAANTVIAVDGGIRHIANMACRADVLIGDGDSANCTYSADLVIKITEQDSSDFDKAIAYCVSLATPLSIVGMGFSGGRLDHYFAVLSRVGLTQQHYPALDIVLLDTFQCALTRCGTCEVAVEIGDMVAVLPLHAMQFSGSTGLQWPLCNRATDWGLLHQLSIANRATATTVVITPQDTHKPYIVTLPPQGWQRYLQT